jgi:hypothetical protein
MTKLIAIVIIAVVLFGGWQLFLYWDKVNHEKEVADKNAASSVITSGQQLGGLPQPLENSLAAAQKAGPTAFANWIKTYGATIPDPRKAWIQLDYCVAVARDNPAEARRVYAEVKSRVSPSSPVYPRVKQLEGTYE